MSTAIHATQSWTSAAVSVSKEEEELFYTTAVRITDLLF